MTPCSPLHYLCRCVDRDEHHVRPLDFFIDIRREEQVSAPAFLDHLQQPRLVDGQVIGIPRVDLKDGQGRRSV